MIKTQLRQGNILTFLKGDAGRLGNEGRGNLLLACRKGKEDLRSKRQNIGQVLELSENL